MAKIEIILSAKRKHLIFLTKKFRDGIEEIGEDKVGILAIEHPENADEVLIKARSMSWVLGDECDDNGFYEVERL